jgi:uncharacterized protein (DUF1697 family)
MPVFVALLRAVNVGGTGKLIMKELVALCEAAGFREVATYIQSGNVVFETPLSAAKARATLEKALSAKLGTEATVVLRTAAQLEALIEHNPFKKQPPNRVMLMFMNDAPTAKQVAAVVSPDGEQLKLAGHDLYVYFPSGLGRTKLKLPFAKAATTRNLNTVTKLASMARKLSG